MKELIAGVALAFTLPSIAHAQEASEANTMACCEKMKAKGKDCCCCPAMAEEREGEHENHHKHGSPADESVHHNH